MCPKWKRKPRTGQLAVAVSQICVASPAKDWQCHHREVAVLPFFLLSGNMVECLLEHLIC